MCTDNAEDVCNKNEKCCSICLEAIDGDKTKTSLECEHSFHEHCIRRWVTSTPRCDLIGFASCPICRRILSESELRKFVSEIELSNRTTAGSNLPLPNDQIGIQERVACIQQEIEAGRREVQRIRSSILLIVERYPYLMEFISSEVETVRSSLYCMNFIFESQRSENNSDEANDVEMVSDTEEERDITEGFILSINALEMDLIPDLRPIQRSLCLCSNEIIVLRHHVHFLRDREYSARRNESKTMSFIPAGHHNFHDELRALLHLDVKYGEILGNIQRLDFMQFGLRREFALITCGLEGMYDTLQFER